MNISTIPTMVFVPPITGEHFMTVGTILTLPCKCWIRRTADYIDEVCPECPEHEHLRKTKHWWRD